MKAKFMKAKFRMLCIVLLMGISVWADDVWNFNVYGDCSKNGYHVGNKGMENGHEWINLGLPSGIKWASCNVGADTPEGYGTYFSWGGVKSQAIYGSTTYPHYECVDYGRATIWDGYTKYCSSSNNGYCGFTDTLTSLDLDDDAAYKNWGTSWRMPTDEEWDELLNNCTWTWTTQNNVNGYLVTSNTNSNSIFLPAAGYRDDNFPNGLYYVGELCSYWSSSLCEDNLSMAWCMDSSNLEVRGHYRHRGCSVRSVCP